MAETPNITNYLSTSVIDSNIRKYTAAANQISKVPVVAINDRFRYSPKSIKIGTQLYGLLDKTALVPYEYDPVALYATLIDYQKFPQIAYKYFPVAGVPDQPYPGEQGVEETAADFRVLYSNVPPPNATQFMNGVRTRDLDMHVENMVNYTGQVSGFNPATLWTPFWNGYYHTQSNEWSWTDNSSVEYGVMCGPVHYLGTTDYGMNATDIDSGIHWTYLSASSTDQSVPATFDNLWELRNLSAEFSWKDFNTPPFSSSIWEAEVLPKKPEEDGIIDFRVDFDVTRSGNSNNQTTTVDVSFNVPLTVAFSNLTPYNIQIIIYCHPYNWWFRERNGSYSTAVECRNSLQFTTYDLETAKAVAASRNPAHTFYDFGTGLQYFKDGKPTYNEFYLRPFETANLIEIDESNIWRSDTFSAQNFHGMRNGWVRPDGGTDTISDNPLNGGTYGFWINLNECFFRIVDEIPQGN